MKIIICGGGTAGHIYPAITIGKELKRRGWQVLFVGTKTGLEAQIVPREDLEFRVIAAKSFGKWCSLRTLAASAVFLLGWVQALGIIRRFEPNVVLGTGGYVSLPVVLAACVLKKPRIIHEENLLPGRANRFLARWANRITISFEDSIRFFPANKVIVTGNPIREQILQVGKEKARENLNLNRQKRVVLVFGGSRGARSINQALLEALPQIIKNGNIQILHISGREEFRRVKEQLEKLPEIKEENYKLFPYISEMGNALMAADLIVSRAGASTLAEISACGRPAILVPYPHSPDNHQLFNAQFFAQRGAAKILLDKELSGCRLANLILELTKDEKSLQEMSRASKSLGKPEALDKILEVIDSLK